MKIAILTCIRSNDVCARVGCLRAFHNREAFFSDYGPDTELAALLTCNGCSRDNPLQPDEDPGIREKIERLKSEGVAVLHGGVCRMHHGVECPRFAGIMAMAEAEGIRTVRGTHRE